MPIVHSKPKPKGEQTMSLTITYPTTNEAHSSRNSNTNEYVGTSATRDTPAKMLVKNEKGNLIPCNYQSWVVAHDHGVGGGVDFVPSGEKQIDSETLNVIEERTFESKFSESGDFYDFICSLMQKPPANVQFIRYDKVEEATRPKEYWSIFGFKIAKMQQRTYFTHHFSLCKLQAPLDKEYCTRIKKKERRAVAWKLNIERLERELSSLSLSEYLMMSSEKTDTFDTFPIEHSEEKVIPSGSSLPTVDGLVSLAKKNFVKKTPEKTFHIIAVQEKIVEVPSTFFIRGKQRVTYRGVALVKKNQ